ncbi:hypothetical protein [Achromobacter animicus]|uniref:hypothetical protein n=1 Tax=Achromobacter animicus TaxID=1389935 RepID=UPI0024493056|nr:hypothetical protein [Achromobacter animicus]MDH0685176.1 hypothetical protein [Achromobacter animicus]
MKLIGSLTEQSFRQQLRRSWEEFREPGNSIFSNLENRLGRIDSAFALGWTPDQSEDFYTILVNGTDVVYLEVLRPTGELVDFQVTSVKEYEKSLRYRLQKIMLLVALDLSGNH